MVLVHRQLLGFVKCADKLCFSFVDILVEIRLA
jgi:hypothetical protein